MQYCIINVKEFDCPLIQPVGPSFLGFLIKRRKLEIVQPVLRLLKYTKSDARFYVTDDSINHC